MALPFFPPQIRSLAANHAANALIAGALGLAIAAGASMPAAAQPEQHKMHHAPGPHGMAKLNVVGASEVQVQPDMATIQVGVSTQADTAAAAMAENSKQQQTVIDLLKQGGIEDRDLQTSGLNLSPVMDYPRDNSAPKVTGYAVQNVVSVRVRDLTKLGALLDQLVQNGANEINSINFLKEDTTDAQAQARVEATKSAQNIAAQLADASGMKLGPLISLSDTTNTVGEPRPMMMMAAAKQAADVPIQAGEVAIAATVNATFALLPRDTDTPEETPKPE